MGTVALPREIAEPHSRLLRCSLCVPESRAYWAHVDPDNPAASAARAFEDSWFGAKSEAWTAELLSNMRARFDGYPAALRVLARWRDMSPDTRKLVCHWHLQLTDPLYRAFTGELLPGRFRTQRFELHRLAVVEWVAANGLERWALKTQVQFASRLLSCAGAAGLMRGARDPRQIVVPRVPDDALAYLLYLLRAVELAGGSLVDNAYLASVHIDGGQLADRLRTMRVLDLRRAGDVVDFEWRYPDLETWSREHHA